MPDGLSIDTTAGTLYQPRFIAVELAGIPEGMAVLAVMRHIH